MDIFLNAHNVYRRKHQVPDLTWDDNLAAGAQQWAEHLATIGKLDHDRNRDEFGENVYSQWSSGEINKDEASQKAVDTWYQEIKNYNFKNPGFKSGVGHFTQVVWKSSQKLGVGVSKCKKNGGTSVYIVARYSPSGNMMRHFEQNVMPPKN